MKPMFEKISNHITKKPLQFSLNSLNLQNNYQDCIMKLLILLTFEQVSLLQQRLIITRYMDPCYMVHIKVLRAPYFPSQVWFWFPLPHTTDVFHVIFSYNATIENHTTESDIPRIVCTVYLRTATALLNSA